MGGHSARRRAIEAVVGYTPPATTVLLATSLPASCSARTCSPAAEMKKRLPKAVFKSVLATIEHGEPLDPVHRRHRRLGDEGLGDREGRHATTPTSSTRSPA